MARQNTYLYRKISLELLHQYPGHVFLRLEPWTGPASMIEVGPGDIVNIGRLGDRDGESGRVTETIMPEVTSGALPAYADRSIRKGDHDV